MQMGKISRGFRIGHRLVKIFKCKRRRATYQRLQPPGSTAAQPFSKLCKWVTSLKRSLCDYGYMPKLQQSVPKGQLAVYVGDQKGDTCRVLVPVIYFNHPFFGELLKEAENVYGFNHPRGIHIPCPKSDLEIVRMKIAAASGGGRGLRRWS